MNIAIATLGPETKSPVPEELSQATHLFLVDVEQFQVTEIIPAPKTGADVFFAKKTVAADCEAILCGDIEKQAFEILAKASVSRYNAAGCTPTQAVRLMNAYQLPVIREYKGGPGHTHHHQDE